MTVVELGSDHPDAPSLDFRPYDPEHGTEGHLGDHCGACARLAPVVVELGETGGDHWQTMQIQWQEACDTIFRQFDDAVADHFPDHLPQNCTTCPEKPILPVKPIQPTERAIAQNAKDDS